VIDWVKVLEIASRVTNPGTIALMAGVLVALMYTHTLTTRRRLPRLLWFVIAIVFVLCLTPTLLSTYERLQGLYRVRVIVLGPDHQPIQDAHVTSSFGGEPKGIAGGWEFDIPPQSRPADGKLKLYASVADAFLKGSSTITLGKEYFPTVTIQLAADTSAMVYGAVTDEHGKLVTGARVSIAGFTDGGVTDEMGNFHLAAHAANGQIVRLHVEKGPLSADVHVPAGNQPQSVVVKRSVSR